MGRSNRLSLGIQLALALGLLQTVLFSQNITYQNPPAFFTCDEATFSFTVQNTGGSTLTNATLTVNFTTTNGTACGIGYVAGTVSAPVTEGNISNPSAPQFLLPPLAAGASQTFTISASADCQTAACIDNAEVFVNDVTLTWPSGSASITTNPYIVDRALLLFTNVSSTIMAGTRGDVLHRKFTIRNTRPAALSSFVFRDVYQPGILISSAQGTIAPTPAGEFETELGPADFAAIGDGDGLFEFNETIIITEDITINSCGVDESSAVSSISAAWGCGNTVCQQENVNAVVAFEPYDKAPQLAWEPIITVPECFCGPNGHVQGMTITNAGDGVALNVMYEMTQDAFYGFGWVDTNSVRVDSSGTDIDFDVTFSMLSSLPQPCDGPASLSSSMRLFIASLEPGASVTIYWDGYFCETGCPPSSTQKPSSGWQYRYSYYKECPPSIFVQNSEPIPVHEVGNELSTWGDFEFTSEPMMDGEIYDVNYTVQYDSLNSLNEQLVVEMVLPCGMFWVDNNQLLLGGEAPASLDIVETDTFTIVTAIYQLPLSNDTASMSFQLEFDCESLCLTDIACEYELQTSCPADEHCIQLIPPTYLFNISTSLLKCPDYPAACNLSYCMSPGKSYDCESDSVCVDAPPGYLRYSFDALRKNYGLPDNNNDQVADAPTGLPDMSLVERQRFIPGDTIQATLRGAVVIDQPGATLPFGTMEIGFSRGADMTEITTDSLLLPNRMTAAGSLLRIFDQSTGTWYECANPPFTTSSKLRYTYNITLLKGTCLPSNFAFDQGDSIVFVGNYRINYNPLPEFGNPTPLLGDIFVNPIVLLTDENSADYSPLDCNCQSPRLLLSYYEYKISPGTFGVPPCGPSSFTTFTALDLNLHEGNFFPYEHRNLLALEDLRLSLPPSVVLNTTRMTSLRLQDGPLLYSQVNFPATLSGGEYIHDLTPYFYPPLDEGFRTLMQFIFSMECTNKFSLPAIHTTTVNFAPGLPEPIDPAQVSVQSNAIRPLIANLTIDATLFDLVSFTNQLVFDFLLKNTPTIAASANSGPAPNAWMYVTSQSGLVTNFQLIDQTTGLPVPAINGIWQLGNLPVNTDGFPYRILGTNNSCEKENLQIHYGWNCDPFQSTVQAVCYEQIQPLTIESPPGEIDMLVDSPTGCSALCDTIPYHTIEVFNAQLGSVYNLRLKALVPPGMNILAGSTVVEYPTGSGNLYPIGDPTVVGTGVVEWNLSMLLDSISAGLPGVGEAPYNSLTLRFLGESTCDFIADAYVLFIAAAEQNCGTPTNSIAKPGDPLCIEGVSSTYTTSINVNTTPGFGCNDAVGFTVSLTSTATLPPGACLIVTLPPGISYQPGSCENQCAPAFNCSPTIDGSQVTWQLPAGTLPNQIVCFQFNTTGWGALGCDNGVVLFRSAAQTQALCAATGDSCSTKVSTGSLIVPFDIQRPAFDLSDFTINATAAGTDDLVDFSIDVTNNGAASLPPTVIQFFLDTDGDGDGDQLVFTQNHNAVIANGQTATVTGNFTVPSALNLCQLIAVIDPALQCACAGDVEQVATPIEYNTGLHWTVCSGADQPVGVPAVPGFDYQWSPDDCLADDQAAMTIFNCVNNGIVPTEYAFTLTEGNGFCQINNLMGVTVQPVPGIAYFDSPICQGESANLAATDGVSFNWQGPGIVQPNQQIQTVTPASTSNYTVTVTDAFGCTGTDVATVVVAPLPVVNAGTDLAFCPGALAQLNATFDPNWDYLWAPQIVGGQSALSSLSISNPLVLTTQTTTFTLNILDENGCSATDAVTVNFADSLLLTMPPDVTICTGNSTTLTVVGNLPATFTWSPDDGTCVNPPSCSSLLVAPTSTTTYTANAVSTDGCLASGSVIVTVVSDQIVTNGPAVEICEGETAVINGETVSQPGIYCDTFTVAGGCDSLHCVELLVKPSVDTISMDTTICQGESVEFEGDFYSLPGEYCTTFPAENGCDSTRCLTLAVWGSPTVNIEFELDTVSIGDTVRLSIPPGDYTDILWFANDSLLADCSGFITCEHIPTDSTVYSVQVTDLNGCSNSASGTITLLLGCDPEKVDVPNAFSPNQDQMNDVFNIVGLGSEVTINMRIWNRWGQKVYDGSGPWNGEQDGKPAASDVYIYLIKVGCAIPVEDMERTLKGDVTLLR